MMDLPGQCQFPLLPERYDKALRQAVEFILERYHVLGIIAGGSILRGSPNPTSDLDIYVIHADAWRQRLQRYFNGVPAEVFINPEKGIQGYFNEEQREGRPITAHILGTGFVVLDTDPVVQQLRSQALELLKQPPNPGEDSLRFMRYMLGSKYEDGMDVAADDPATASMLLSDAVHEMATYAFLKANRLVPREKELIAELCQLDERLGNWVKEFYATGDYQRRLYLAEQIAGSTIVVLGFFEWDSKPENF